MAFGCSTPSPQLYAGEPRTREEISVIVAPIGYPADVVRIDEFDTRGSEWHVLPGEHRVVIQVKTAIPMPDIPNAVEVPGQHYYYKTWCDVSFDAEAGRSYIVRFEVLPGSVRAWLVDGSTEDAVGKTRCKTRMVDATSSPRAWAGAA